MTSSTNDSSPEAPWPLRRLSELLGGYIDRLGAVWIEAEVTQWSQSAGNIYGKLTDLESDTSVGITIWRRSQENIPEGISRGDRVIAQVKPSWWAKGGTLSMNVLQMRHTGLGEILEKLEKLRATLSAEGLFAPEHKIRLPFLPGTIGLVTGKDSDAEKDVITNATLRWPDVSFRIEYAAVQGDRCVPEVIKAMEILDQDPEVDVIIVARGGGDFLHLLPFSDEALVRAAAALATPLVSAIGHEADRPLLDDVADLRASTPTDAAKRVVPDVENERSIIAQARSRLDNRLLGILDYEAERLSAVKSRPSLADPQSMVDLRAQEIMFQVARGDDLSQRQLERTASEIGTLSTSLRGLSPQKTLDRGYAIARLANGTVVTAVGDVSPGDALALVVRDGTIDTHVD